MKYYKPNETPCSRIDAIANQLKTVRRDAECVLTVAHVEAAKCWDDWADMIKWAIENGATVSEMQMYHRSTHGQDLFSK